MNYTQWETQQMQSDLENNNRMSAQAQPEPDPGPVSDPFRMHKPVPNAQSPGESLSGWAASRAVITLCHTRDNGGRKWKWGVVVQNGFFFDCCCMTLASEICFVAARLNYCYYLQQGQQQYQQQQVPAGAFRIGQCGGKIACRHAMSNGCSLSPRGRGWRRGEREALHSFVHTMFMHIY